MFDSAVVDVVIGILVFSLVVSGVQEAAARVFSWRSKSLWAGIHRLIDAPSDAAGVPRNRLLHSASEGDLRPRQVEQSDITGLVYAHHLTGGLEDLKEDAALPISRAVTPKGASSGSSTGRA